MNDLLNQEHYFRYVTLLLILFLRRDYVGRRELASIMGVGEGVVRGLISRARAEGHVLVTRAGTKISEKGVEYVEDLLRRCGVVRVGFVDLSRLICGNVCVGFVVRGRLDGVIRLRDEVVRSGACGALILHSHEGRLEIPPTNLSLHEVDEYADAEVRKLVAGILASSSVVVSCAETIGRAVAALRPICAWVK